MPRDNGEYVGCVGGDGRGCSDGAEGHCGPDDGGCHDDADGDDAEQT